MSVKKVIFFTIIIVLGFVINNLTQAIYSTWQKKHLVTQKKEELAKEKWENEELKQKIINVSQPGFVEEQARNKLLLAKPGEEVVVMPTVAPQKTVGTQSSSYQAPNWELWWRLFFTKAP